MSGSVTTWFPDAVATETVGTHAAVRHPPHQLVCQLPVSDLTHSGTRVDVQLQNPSYTLVFHEVEKGNSGKIVRGFLLFFWGATKSTTYLEVDGSRILQADWRQRTCSPRLLAGANGTTATSEMTLLKLSLQ